jgi:hypothetical protein
VVCIGASSPAPALTSGWRLVLRLLILSVLLTATLATQDVIDDKDLSCLNDANLSPVPPNASQARRNNGRRSKPSPIARNSRSRLSSAAKEPGDAPEPGAAVSRGRKLLNGRRRSAINSTKDYRRDGANGLGESESCAAARSDAAPDRLRIG